MSRAVGGVWALCLALSGCSAPEAPRIAAAPGNAEAPAVPNETPVAVAVETTDPEPWRHEIYRDRWPTLDATLLGVDAKSRRAWVKLRSRRPHRYVIDTVDLDSGKRLERWEAGQASVAALADYDARFLPLAGDHQTDLRRLGTMVASWPSRARREGSAWPVADASASGRHIVFMREPAGGQQGDWLFLRDTAAQRETRIARQTVASYDAKFSPDGAFLAWRGCVGRRPCRYHLYMSSVDAAAKGKGPRRLAVREPRGPIWTPSGDAVLALGTIRGGKRCITATTVPTQRPWRLPKTTMHACDDKLTDYALAPNGEALVYMTRDGADAVLHYKRLGDTDTRTEEQLRDVSEVTVSANGTVLADHKDGLLAIDLHRKRRRLYVSPTGGFVFVPTVHWLGDDEAIMLEKSFADQTVRLVRLDVRAFLDEA